MKKFAIAALMVFVSAFCFGQAPRAGLSLPDTGLYVGYVSTFPDYGRNYTSFLFSGAELDYVKLVSPRWSLVASGMGSFGTVYKVKQATATVGPKFSVLKGRFRPYITAQAGFAYQSSKGMYAIDHNPPLTPGADSTERGFTYRAGIGADFQVSRKVYWRVAGWDVQAMPWARHTPYYQNLTSGFGYQF